MHKWVCTCLEKWISLLFCCPPSLSSCCLRLRKLFDYRSPMLIGFSCYPAPGLMKETQFHNWHVMARCQATAIPHWLDSLYPWDMMRRWRRRGRRRQSSCQVCFYLVFHCRAPHFWHPVASPPAWLRTQALFETRVMLQVRGEEELEQVMFEFEREYHGRSQQQVPSSWLLLELAPFSGWMGWSLRDLVPPEIRWVNTWQPLKLQVLTSWEEFVLEASCSFFSEEGAARPEMSIVCCPRAVFFTYTLAGTCKEHIVILVRWQYIGTHQSVVERMRAFLIFCWKIKQMYKLRH